MSTRGQLECGRRVCEPYGVELRGRVAPTRIWSLGDAARGDELTGD
jgi:hypothetical protein